MEDKLLNEGAIHETLSIEQKKPITIVALNEASQLFSEEYSRPELAGQITHGHLSPPGLRSPESNQIFDNADEVTSLEK